MLYNSVFVANKVRINYNKISLYILMKEWGLIMEDRIELGDVIKMKKQHPCGTNEWEVLRTGMDFRLKCLGCNHQVMVSRKLVEKNFRGFIRRAE